MSRALAGRATSRWIWVAAVWLGVGLFDATQTVFSMRAEGMHHAWVKLFVTLLLAWVPLACATPVILDLARRFPLARFHSATTWAAHISAWFAICVVSSIWVAGFERLLDPWNNPGGPGSYFDRVEYRFFGGLVSYFVLYGAILGVGHALDSSDRLAREQTQTARLSEQLSRAQLNALRRQIEPHFLFNTLNAIAGLVRERRNEEGVSMIAQLSDFLRRTIEDSNRQEVPLSEEIDYLQRYLAIQKVRFADRLRVDFQVPEDLMLSQVPSLVLQPVVENAIKHGIAKQVQGGRIRISASRSNGMVSLKVYNDGPALRASDKPTAGIGILNLRTRLENLYGTKFELTLRDELPHGVEACVSLPFREK
ncbi:MAG TPA: histidine kinase [Terriglobales bacterium]